MRASVTAHGARRCEAHRRAADEAGDERVGRIAVDRVGIADLLQDAVAHDRDAVAHRHRLDLVVGHVDGGRADLALEALDLTTRLRPQLRVEVRQRFVHEKDLRIANERASERDALALPAGELARLAVEQSLDVEEACGALDAARDLRALQLAHTQAEGEVLPDGHLRVQRVVLEDHGDVAVARGHVVDDALSDPDVAVGERLEAGEQAEGRGLAATGGADQHHELAVADLERELGDGDHRPEVPGRAIVGDGRHR